MILYFAYVTMLVRDSKFNSNLTLPYTNKTNKFQCQHCQNKYNLMKNFRGISFLSCILQLKTSFTVIFL